MENHSRFWLPLASVLLALALLSGCNSPAQLSPGAPSPNPSPTPIPPYPGMEMPTPTFSAPSSPYPGPTPLQPTEYPTVEPASLSQPYDLIEEDNGKTFTYKITSRFTISLDDKKHPLKNLTCTPEGIIGSVSNGSVNGPDNYPIMFEAVQAGECLLHNGDFQVHIIIPP